MKTLCHWFFVAKSERTSDVGVHAETYRRFVNDTPYYDGLALLFFVFLRAFSREKGEGEPLLKLPRESVTDAKTMAASCGPSKDGQEADKGIDYGASSYASRLTPRVEKGGGALCPSPRRTRRTRRAHAVDHGVLGVLCSGATRTFLAPARPQIPERARIGSAGEGGGPDRGQQENTQAGRHDSQVEELCRTDGRRYLDERWRLRLPRPEWRVDS